VLLHPPYYNIIRFGDKKGNGLINPTYMIAALHGAGGGMYIGSGANRQERLGAIIDGLDILVTGHTHRPLMFPVEKLSFDARNNRMSRKQFRAVTATSWLDYSDYAMSKMLPPTAHLLNEIRLCGSKKVIRTTM
jgi:hypothetical protein